MTHAAVVDLPEVRLPPPADPVGLQRRPPADRRALRRDRGGAGAGLRLRELHHVRPLAGAGGDAAPIETPEDVAARLRRARRGGALRPRPRAPRPARPLARRGRREAALRDAPPRDAQARSGATRPTPASAASSSRRRSAGATSASSRSTSSRDARLPRRSPLCLALAEALGVEIHYVAPAIGFQKNFPYPDDAELRRTVESLCRRGPRVRRLDRLPLGKRQVGRELRASRAT